VKLTTPWGGHFFGVLGMKTMSYGLKTTCNGFGTCRYLEVGTLVKKIEKFIERQHFEKVFGVRDIKTEVRRHEGGISMTRLFKIGRFGHKK
jgi:hypothetical protein